MLNQTVKPRILAFEITRKCRFNCRHCRAGGGRAQTKKDLSTQQCKRILKAVEDYNKAVVIFTGGEPMERADIYDLVAYARGLGLRSVMASCGYSLSEQSLERLRASGLLAMSFSLDGASRESNDAFRESEGAFDAVVEAAQLCRQVGLSLGRRRPGERV